MDDESHHQPLMSNFLHEGPRGVLNHGAKRLEVVVLREQALIVVPYRLIFGVQLLVLVASAYQLSARRER